MSSVNKIILMGRAGRDAEVRYLPSGDAVANVPMATSTFRKDKSTGERIEETQWHRVTLFGRQAEVAGEYITKGSLFYVEGRIKYGKYTDKDGVEKPTCDIVANELKLMGKSPESTSHSAPQQQAVRPAPRQAPATNPARQSSGFDDMDDDIPF